METIKILFFTDIHQNIEAVKRLNFNEYNLIICGGDILNPSHPDINRAMAIIDLMPPDTIITPGNCDKNNVLIQYIQERLIFLHKKGGGEK